MPGKKQNTNLINQIQQILLEIPHLSDEKREFWQSKITTLTDQQLTDLFSILTTENNNFTAALTAELNTSASESDLIKLKEIINKSTRQLSTEEEASERALESQKIDQLLKKL